MDRVLFQKLERLKEELFYLKKSKPELLKKLKTSIEAKKIAERSIYLCSEIVLDISDLIIIKKGYPKASTYSDSIYKLGDYAIIPKGFAHKFVYIAGLRNFLAHDYQKNTVPELEKFLKSGIKDIEQFIKYIERL
ncbi:MAG: DUF86 domain-containing protein [Nitrospirae bacterium]|nr:DUF86 domain-containing protein [Nitrospirota bacterium]